MVSFTYTDTRMIPKLDETFATLGADWSVSSATYVYVSGGELYVTTQAGLGVTYQRHWAKHNPTIKFGAMRARFKMSLWTIPALTAFPEDQTMDPLPDGTNKIFYCEAAQTPVKPGSLTVKKNGVVQVEGVDYTVTSWTLGKITFVTAPLVGDSLQASWERADWYCIYSWRFRALLDSQCYALVFDFWRKKIRIIRFNGTTDGYDQTYDIASVDMTVDFYNGSVRYIQCYAEEEQIGIKAIRVGVYTDSAYTVLETSVEASITGTPQWLSPGYTMFSSESKNNSTCLWHLDDYIVRESITGRDSKFAVTFTPIKGYPNVKPAHLKVNGCLFSDDFSTVKSQWTLQDATISGGVLTMSPTEGVTCFALNSTNLTDFVFDGKLKVVTIGTGSSEVDIRFRRTDNSNEYALSFLTNLGRFKLRKLVAGIWTDIDSLAHTFSDGDILYWRVQAVGSAISVWVWDSTLTLLWNSNQTDTTFSSGNFRITAYDTGSFEADNVAVYVNQTMIITPVQEGLQVRVYDADTLTLLDTQQSVGCVATFSVSDITKYQFVNKNVFIKVYDSTDTIFQYQPDTMYDIYGGDTWEHYVISEAANDYHVVISLLGSIGKILSTIFLKATITRSEIPMKGIVLDLGNIGKILVFSFLKAYDITLLRARTSFRDYGPIGKFVTMTFIKASNIVLLWPCAHKDRDACDTVTTSVAYVGSFVTY